MDLKHIDIGNGRTAISFVPEDSKELAIVHLKTIQRLARMLPKANPRVIVQELINELEGINHDKTSALPDAINICNEFTAFHETVNLIESYVPAPVMEDTAMPKHNSGRTADEQAEWEARNL